MNRARFPHLLLFIAVVSLPLSAQHQHEHTGSPPARLGDVTFPTSCQPSVQPEFNRAVALLHSFWYEKAAETFQEVARTDPKCAIAHWGVAMTWFRPLWHPPTKEHRAQGRAAIEKAQAIGGATARERGYINALAAFYRDSETVDHRTRVLAYEQAMADVAAQNAGDEEAQIFHALAILGAAAASPPDKTFARQKKAGAMLEPVFQRRPQHPGVAHYIIHSYDYPELAERALEAARRYAKIAPDSPHALHMPSHIFTRLGLWPESIGSNLDSAAAGRKNNSAGDELHALDYLVYAYLQQGRDAEARKIAELRPELKEAKSLYFAAVYSLAAIPARMALERRLWADAAALEPPANLPGGQYAWAGANFSFARSLGAARTGDLEKAQEAISDLGQRREELLKAGEKYWSDQVEVQRKAAAGWLAHARKSDEEALKLLREAADLEDSMDKHPVTPGAVVPARELLADLLLELGRPGEALAEYQKVLGDSPNRFHALHGAARSAERAGKREAAAGYYRKLLEVADDAAQRPELAHARQYVAVARGR